MLASYQFPKASLLALGALALLGTSACQNDDDAVVPWENTRVAITSDPEGAIIEVDGANTGRLTPATLSNLVGRHSIVVRMEADGISYGYRADVDVRGDSVHRIPSAAPNQVPHNAPKFTVAAVPFVMFFCDNSAPTPSPTRLPATILFTT